MLSFLNQLSPYIRKASNSFVSPPWETDRVIFDFELLYIKSGQARIKVENETYLGGAGNLFFFRPKQDHSIKVLGPATFNQPHIHFDFVEDIYSKEVKISHQPLESIPESKHHLFRKDLTQEINLAIPPLIPLKNPDYFETMLFDLISEYDAKLPYYQTQVKGLLIQLWTYLIRDLFWNTASQRQSQKDLLLEIKDYLTFNANKNLTLKELEDQFAISKYHLIRLFKDAYGTSPIQFHQLIRIEKAKDLIQFTDDSITEIAEKMGYTGIHSFSRAFKKVDHVSPTFYRK